MEYGETLLLKLRAAIDRIYRRVHTMPHTSLKAPLPKKVFYLPPTAHAELRQDIDEVQSLVEKLDLEIDEMIDELENLENVAKRYT